MLILQQKLITIGVLYYYPDYPSLIQEFIWQVEDITPSLPKVYKFLNHWKNNIEAPIKDVLIMEGNKNYRFADLEMFLN